MYIVYVYIIDITKAEKLSACVEKDNFKKIIWNTQNDGRFGL